MVRWSHPRNRRLAPAFVAVLVVGLALPAADGAALSGRAWEACRDRVIAGGRSGGGLAAVIERCGYRGGPPDRALCDDLYEQVYPACREDGFDGMSMAADAWVAVLDPGGPVVTRLRQVCVERAALDRAAFGRRVCGELASGL